MEGVEEAFRAVWSQNDGSPPRCKGGPKRSCIRSSIPWRGGVARGGSPAVAAHASARKIFRECSARRARSGGFLHQAGPDAAGANANAPHGAIGSDVTDVLQIRQPDALRLVIGMAHVVAYLRRLSAKLTFPAHWVGSFPAFRGLCHDLKYYQAVHRCNAVFCTLRIRDAKANLLLPCQRKHSKRFVFFNHPHHRPQRSTGTKNPPTSRPSRGKKGDAFHVPTNRNRCGKYCGFQNRR